MFQLSSSSVECRYFVVVSVVKTHEEISVSVRSPLQISNDLCLPVDLCFKKSALLNLDRNERSGSPTLSLLSMGSASNPFDDYPAMTTLLPDETFSVPLLIAYHSPIFITPSATDYRVSESGIWWKEMQSSMNAKILPCLPKSGDGYPVSVACSIIEGVKIRGFESDDSALLNPIPNYLLRLSAPIRVFNYLPVTLVLHHKALPQPITLDPGGTTSIYKMDPHRDEELDVTICNYRGSDWKSVLRIPIERKEASRTLVLNQVDSVQRSKLEVSLYTLREVTTSVYIYAPYWIVNKTGLPMQVKGSKSKFLNESNGSEEILVFRYKRNHPHKIKIRVLESEWSRSWSCDAVGTCGVVICEDKQRCKKFRILARISQSTLKAELPIDGRKCFPKAVFHLTKIVTLMPYFLVKNCTSKPLMYMQDSDKNGLWFDVGPNQCESYWPSNDDTYLVVRRRESHSISQRFHFNSVHKTVLRIEKGKALVVSVEGVGSDQPVMITFSKYRSGDAPVRLENWCEEVFFRFHQRGSNQVTLLAPRQSLLYTWDDPTLQRDLLWNIYSRKAEDFTAIINMDKNGTEKLTVTSMKPNAVRTQSHSGGFGNPKVRPKRFSLRQRAKTAPSSSSEDDEDEVADGWLIVGKEKLGKGQNPQTSGQKQLRGTKQNRITVHWVCYREGDQRVLLFTQSERLAQTLRLPNESASLDLVISIERLGLSILNNYGTEIMHGGLMPSVPMWHLEVDGVWKIPPSLELCSWLEDQYLHHSQPCVNLKGSMQVDLTRMRMVAPFSGRLRRIRHPSIWFQYRQSDSYCYCRTRIASFQVDNQQEDAIFPTVLACNRNKIYEKPAVDFCIMTHLSARHERTIRHLSIINEDIELNIDKGFLLNLYNLVAPCLYSLEKVTIHSELKTLLTPLSFSAINKCESDSCILMERFCFAGLKLKVSYSTKGLPPKEKVPDVIEGLLVSLGVNLGEVNDVQINVSQAEIEASTIAKVIADITSHLKTQFLHQMYVLILGIDILANPYQRLKDLSQGVRELIYDSTACTMEAPDDFAEEISDECYSLCGHVRGDEGHNYFILGSTFDCDIRALFKDDPKPELSFSGFTSGASLDQELKVPYPSRWLSPAGLVWSLTGTVMDPNAGSPQESMESFLRGKGRGLVGLIANPSFGVNDPVAMAIDALQRSQCQGYEAYFRLRPSRHSCALLPLRPKCLHETEGLNILSSLPQRYLSPEDKYFGHVYLARTKLPPIFLTTLHHFYYLEPSGNWGRCEVVWRLAVKNLTKQPDQSGDTITFQLRQDESQSHLSGAVRLIQCNEQKILEKVMKLVSSLMTLQMEYLPSPSTT